MQKARIHNPVQVVRTVHAAICYLEGQGQFADRSQFPFPSIIMLDLRLPNSDGFELLQWLGTRPEFRRLHLVVLSGMGPFQDIQRAYKMGASSFLTKPIKEQDLRSLADGFPDHWT